MTSLSDFVILTYVANPPPSLPSFPVLLGRSTRALWWRVLRTWAWRCSSRWSSCPIFTSPASPCWRPTAFPRLTTTSFGYACAGTGLFSWLRREMAHGPNTPLTHGGGQGLDCSVLFPLFRCRFQNRMQPMHACFRRVVGLAWRVGWVFVFAAHYHATNQSCCTTPRLYPLISSLVSPPPFFPP